MARIKCIVTSIVFLSLQCVGAVTKVNGAGATFPFPLYSKWFSEYQKVKKDVQFNYNAIGSGGGVRQLLKETVDFGASDVPMSVKKIKKAKFKIKQIPTVLGAVAIAYNVSEIPTGLKLDGETLSHIFLGKITKWNHPSIVKLNSGVTLPKKDILRVARSDGSGTTAVFTNYLSSVSSEFKSTVKTGKKVRWPSGGIASKGNDGVTNMVKQTDGAIGYVELAYAEKNNLKVVSLKNQAGEFLTPTIDGVSKAAQNIDASKITSSIVNSDAKGAYPISTFTYILVPELKTNQNTEVKSFLAWALSEGQKFAAELHYAPLPKGLAETLIKELK